MSCYTCISCRVAFADGEVQRAHYKSDWHRYNLKRKVADMPPVSADNFQERVLSQRAAAERRPGDDGEVCALCRKKFSSHNAFNDHLRSQRHLQAERRALEAARRQVEEMNRKNLEKGIGGDDKADRDARNEALQQALEGRRRGGRGETTTPLERSVPEKPPRLVWLEEQAKRREREENSTVAATEEEEWEDMDDDDDDDEEEKEEDEEEEYDDEESTEHTEGDASGSLPGSIPVTDCLFCTHHSKTLMRNVAHMTRVHSFFIPDLQYLADLRGLVRYLGEKVGAGNVCLWCNEKGRSFYSTEAVRSHMTDKSHCKLFTDGDAALEFADFYDFRSSYPDRSDDDEELPDDKNIQYDDETMELTLPSGARVGHRSLMRYYKQRFGTERTLALSHNRNAVGRVLRHYKALGWAGNTGAAGARGVHRDMQYVQMMKSKWMLKMGMSHNTTRQKHFRAQVMF
ncbi:cytoplasmic 60S subunit biogenesis factor ZNF622 [Corythoichthys intestinalis]|uniref:cytoplasmic 60S subunit biogenesis factor ZNF622 n=1 Tax=Corythoichthys intestinalis TaxID=161448 RepID=UPI0025A6898A|nr:cytoplasmic 60S subunit biogenesis factor ZNF622 [Corythoichthys intestinalis]XP_061795821.1 cytoplasmic 60S subunit biogenesis factor ZNF622-like [Nerophis lumbriciformis]